MLRHFVKLNVFNPVEKIFEFFMTQDFLNLDAATNFTQNSLHYQNNKLQYTSILIIALAFHLFFVNSKLLYSLNQEPSNKATFSFSQFNEPNILAMLFAVSYSLATISVLRTTRKKQLIVIFALMDAFGVLVQYYPEMSRNYKAVYFAIYTGLLIISTIYLDNPEYLSDAILEMKQKGVSQKEIAQKLDISESMVSRTVKRVQEAKG